MSSNLMSSVRINVDYKHFPDVTCSGLDNGSVKRLEYGCMSEILHDDNTLNSKLNCNPMVISVLILILYIYLFDDLIVEFYK